MWHGAGWNYVIYGLIQGLIISYEMVTVAYRNKMETSVGKHVFGAYSILRTYLLFAFSLLFFRLPSLSDAGYMISHLSFNLHTSIKELRLGMTDQECIVAGVAVVLLFLYEYFMSKQDLLQALNQRHRIIPVSYTHLDVYKRQLLHLSGGICSSAGNYALRARLPGRHYRNHRRRLH